LQSRLKAIKWLSGDQSGSFAPLQEPEAVFSGCWFVPSASISQSVGG
jgi:hypothetical protein